jgi:hypothetical protein
MRYGGWVLACFCVSVAGSVSADDAAAPNAAWVANAATIAHIREVVGNTKGADGVFVVLDNGDIRHVQSGLVCPAKFPNVDFWHAEVFDSSGQGTDVGCDYGRQGPAGHWVSKLTIYATRAPDGLTLDQAFAQDRGEFMQVSPNAVSQGDAVKVQGSTSPLPEIRSEEFVSMRGDGEYTDDVLVAMQSGWILEIRTTFLGKPNTVEMANGATVEDAVNAIADRAMTAEAFAHVAQTIGK